MKKLILLFVAFGITGYLAQAQVITTLPASNVTAWSAQLYGSYAGLATGRTYSGTIYYGLSNGGTNELSWSNASSGFGIEPSGTGDVAGTYSRTVVELLPTNTYYYRARVFDFDTLTATWATQTLTFVTGNQAPTAMPAVAFAAVTVDTNGVLHSPLDFFEKNGVLPTQAVAGILARLGSNETAIATKPDSNTVWDTFVPMISFSSATGALRALIDVALGSLGTGWSGVSATQTVQMSGHNIAGAGAITSQQLRVSGDVSLANVGTPTNTVYLRYLKGLRLGSTTGTDINITGGDVVSGSGPGGPVNINGGVSLAGTPKATVTINGHAFNESAITLNAAVTINGSVAGNAPGVTNIPLTGLRLSNAYTGGVMRLVTTDGVTFFLQ